MVVVVFLVAAFVIPVPLQFRLIAVILVGFALYWRLTLDRSEA